MITRPDYPVIHLLRGLSALFVCLGHLRATVMVDHAHSQFASHWLTKLFYFITGFGHAAVMIFFVLSGFLVGGPALRQLLAGSFRWRTYLIQRFSRLYVTLIPALGLTLVLHVLGQWLAPDAYAGALHERLSSGPQPGEPQPNPMVQLVVHLSFLQGVVSPAWSSNGPLWSLACEAWYYLWLPVAGCLILMKHERALRWFLATGLLVMLTCLILLASEPSMWFLGFAVWCCGVCAALRVRHADQSMTCDKRPGHHHAETLEHGPLRNETRRRLVGYLRSGSMPVLLWLSVLVGIRVYGHHGSVDLLLGATTAWVLLGHVNTPIPRWIMVPGRWFSTTSYSLYLVHFPIQFFICAVLLEGQQFDWGLTGLAVYAMILALNLAAAWLFHQLFERHTDAVRNWLMRKRPDPVLH